MPGCLELLGRALLCSWKAWPEQEHRRKGTGCGGPGALRLLPQRTLIKPGDEAEAERMYLRPGGWGKLCSRRHRELHRSCELREKQKKAVPCAPGMVWGGLGGLRPESRSAFPEEAIHKAHTRVWTEDRGLDLRRLLCLPIAWWLQCNVGASIC